MQNTATSKATPASGALHTVARPENGNDRLHSLQDDGSIAPLRIAVYGIRTIPSTYSGYETFCNILLPALATRGHDVTLFSREASGRQPSHNGVKKIGLPSIATKQLDTLSHSFSCALASRFGGFDVVLTFNVANSPSLFFLTKTGIPTIINVDGQEWKRDKWGKLAKRVFYLCAKWSQYTSTQQITDCHEMASIYRSEFGNNTHVIPYCWTGLINDAEIDDDESSTLEQFGIRKGEYYLTGGRLVPENNIAEIVESHVASNASCPIVVLGEANYDSPVQTRLNELAKQHPNVRLLGHISDRRTFGVLLRDAAMYLHGHSVGGINPSLVEAMGVGAMIAAYDTRFNREALGDCGVFFDNPLTAVKVTIGLTEALDTNELRKNARLRVHRLYSEREIVDLYESLLVSTARPASDRSRQTATGQAQHQNMPIAWKSTLGTNIVRGVSCHWHDLIAENTKQSLYTLAFKRVVDIALACLLLAALSPVALLLCVLVRLNTGKNVIYRQRRVGRLGRTFDILKFRTMQDDRRLASVAVSNERRIGGHKNLDDPRHTKLGRVLRTFGLDEAPQLINVLRGDMSMVGPRPEIADVAVSRGYVFHPRHTVRPGITGPYQLSPLRDSGNLQTGLAMDDDYVRNISLLADLKYIMITPFMLVARRLRKNEQALPDEV